jgi:hypothetical protein
MSFTWSEAPVRKMILSVSEPAVRAWIPLGRHLVDVNALIGKSLRLEWPGMAECQSCGGVFSELHAQGFCRTCFFNSPLAGASIVRPELSTAHLGKADRDLEFERAYQLQPHTVYLADSGGVKVGVTRTRQQVTRWLDQGASCARAIAVTENRYEAGLIEVALKQHFSDKTDWRKMLAGLEFGAEFEAAVGRALEAIPADLQRFAVADGAEHRAHWSLAPGFGAKSVKLSKPGEVLEGVLAGQRGQYLAFADGRVLNVRSHEGLFLRIQGEYALHK